MRIRSFNYYDQVFDRSGKSGGIHPYCEMLYFTQGETVLEWMGNEYEVPASSLFLLTPNTPHLLRFPAPLSFWFIELDIGESDPFVTLEQAMEWNRFQRDADYRSAGLLPIKLSLDALTSTLLTRETGASYDEEIALLDIRKTLLLVRKFFHGRHELPGDQDPTTRQSIQWLIRYMETNYSDTLDLTALAKRVHLNPSYLVRTFKSEAGVTPIHYLNKLRLSAAVSFLANTDMGIQQIAEATEAYIISPGCSRRSSAAVLGNGGKMRGAAGESDKAQGIPFKTKYPQAEGAWTSGLLLFCFCLLPLNDEWRKQVKKMQVFCKNGME